MQPQPSFADHSGVQVTLVAGIDSSTQSCKVVICDLATGEIVRSGRATHPDATEVDPELWWQALRLAITDAGGLSDVAAVSVGAQQHGMVVLDIHGRVIRPALLWNDTRSARAARTLIDEVGAQSFAERTGSVPTASFTLTKLRWLRDVEPEHAKRVAAIALPHDWLTWRLRGYGPQESSALGPVLNELTTDRSDASGTSYWNPTAGAYDHDLIERALRPTGASEPWVAPVLPRVVEPHLPAGIVGSGTDYPVGMVVGAGAGDNAAAAFGLNAGIGDVVVSLGTSGTVFAVTESAITDASGTVAGFADATGNFLPLIATLNAARIVDAIARILGVDYDELGRLALAAEPGSAGLVLQPYFEGERTPNRPDATATLFGMTLASTTRENLARAGIEGMLAGLADGLAALEAHGVTARRILLIGGAAQSDAVQKIAAQVFAAPVHVPDQGEYVAIGAARQAAWALTGSAPLWSIALAQSLGVNTRPEIRLQYSARA